MRLCSDVRLTGLFHELLSGSGEMGSCQVELLVGLRTRQFGNMWTGFESRFMPFIFYLEYLLHIPRPISRAFSPSKYCLLRYDTCLGSIDCSIAALSFGYIRA